MSIYVILLKNYDYEGFDLPITYTDTLEEAKGVLEIMQISSGRSGVIVEITKFPDVTRNPEPLKVLQDTFVKR